MGVHSVMLDSRVRKTAEAHGACRVLFLFSSRRRHTRYWRDWSSDVCSSDLQLMRVYGQALAQIADAEVRLFHIYVHEPLIREGVPGIQMAEEMENLARDLLPLASPLMDYIHQRFLQHYVEQDVVGHMEIELDSDVDLGRLRVALAFCDQIG